MRRDFLKSLGIEDKELIHKILDENSSDLGRAKGELENHKSQVNDLKRQLATKDDEIANLQEKADSVEGLNQQIAQLNADKTQLTSELTTKVATLQKTYNIEGGIRDAKAKNVKAVMALLDMDKISFADGVLTGLKEQLENLRTSEDTSFLFADDTHKAPSGTNVYNPDINKGATSPSAFTLNDAIAKVLGGNK